MRGASASVVKSGWLFLFRIKRVPQAVFGIEILLGDTLDLGGGVLPTTPGYADHGFVAEFDADGNLVASVSIGHPSSLSLELPKLALGGGGELFLQGKFWEAINLGNGPLLSNGNTDLFLARLDDMAP